MRVEDYQPAREMFEAFKQTLAEELPNKWLNCYCRWTGEDIPQHSWELEVTTFEFRYIQHLCGAGLASTQPKLMGMNLAFKAAKALTEAEKKNHETPS